MTTLTIPDLDDSVNAKLRVRAAQHGWSAEEEARKILCAAVTEDTAQPEGLGSAIRRLFEPLGGMELELPPREKVREPPIFD